MSVSDDMKCLLEESTDVGSIPSGGYNYKFTKKELLEEFICPVCNLVSHKPHQATCCGKIYCKSCLRKLRLSQKFECKNCSQHLSKKYFKDVNTERRILDLEIYCPNTEQSCKWIGSIKNITDHLKDCLYQLKACPNNCSELIYPVELEKHLKDICTHRSTICPYCHITDIHQIITGSHYSECTEVPIACPNKECDEIHVRRLMEDHREVCPKEKMLCPFSSIGCRQLMKREKMELHTQNTIERHLDLAMTHIVALNSDIDEMTFRVTQMTNQIEELKLRFPPPLPTQKVVIKMSHFDSYKNNGKLWYSPAFTCSGYRMCLCVHANGTNEAKGTHVSCYICLMSGEYDDILEWPFQGEVTVELLNQLRDNYHEKTIIKYNASTEEIYSCRVIDKAHGEGWGKKTFVPHSNLIVDENYCQYLKDNTLYFRVSAKVTSRVKPWLIPNLR